MKRIASFFVLLSAAVLLIGCNEDNVDGLGISFEQPGVFEIGETKSLAYTLTGDKPSSISTDKVPAGWDITISGGKINITCLEGDHGTMRNGRAYIVLFDSNGATTLFPLDLRCNLPLVMEFEQPEPFAVGEVRYIDFTLPYEYPTKITANDIPTGWAVEIINYERRMKVTCLGVDSQESGVVELLLATASKLQTVELKLKRGPRLTAVFDQPETFQLGQSRNVALSFPGAEPSLVEVKDIPQGWVIDVLPDHLKVTAQGPGLVNGTAMLVITNDVEYSREYPIELKVGAEFTLLYEDAGEFELGETKEVRFAVNPAGIAHTVSVKSVSRGWQAEVAAGVGIVRVTLDQDPYTGFVPEGKVVLSILVGNSEVATADVEVVAKDYLAPYTPWASSFKEGDGSQQSPYLITTAAEFARLIYISRYRPAIGTNATDGKYFKLMKDITAIKFDGSGWGTSWEGASFFLGHFDGNGHSLTGDLVGSSNFCVFHRVSGSVSNFTVKGNITNTNTDPSARTGGIAALVSGPSLISNCHYEGTLKGSGFPTGGIVGSALGIDDDDITITGCTVRGEVHGGSTSGSYTGGIIGVTFYGVNIENCTNYAAVIPDTSDKSYVSERVTPVHSVGGIVGEMCVGTMHRCYNYGSVGTAVDDAEGVAIGGIVGYSADPVYLDKTLVYTCNINSGTVAGQPASSSNMVGIGNTTMCPTH